MSPWRKIPCRTLRQSFLLQRQLVSLCSTDYPQKCKRNRLRRYCSSDFSSSMTLQNTFKCYELESGPPEDIEISRPEALKLYKQMLRCRRMEHVAAELYKQQKIRGFCHLYTGQEAVAVGMRAAMRRQDSLITAYRCHAWTYLMGVPVEAIIAELIGFRSGCSRGKGGSMHMYSDRFYGGNGIVGAQVPLGTGVALAHSFRQDGGVSVICYGDGAANQGQLFESYNIAKLWCLPCIFVCENNKYGMGTRTDRAAACTDFYMRGHYIPGLWVDGNQVLAVRSATEFAIQHALEKGPLIMEMFTYRYMGHSMSDPGVSYRKREEIDDARQHRDPITSFRKQLIKLDLACDEELKEMEIEVRKQIDEDKNKALKGREVELNELVADVYAKNVAPKIRGISGYNFEHVKLSEVCLGKVKATPRSMIKDVPVGDAAMAAAMAEAKKAAAEKQTAEAKTQVKRAPKLGDKGKAVTPAKVEDKTKKAPEVKAPGVKASVVKPPESKAPKAKSSGVKAPPADKPKK